MVQKKILVMAVPPAPVRVHSQKPLAPSVALVTSVANDKGDNEMILGAVHRSRSPCDEEAVRQVIVPNAVK